jgi:hypothetical protein
VLLAALMIQALTPDFLDLSLLSNELPPGPLFVLSSFAGSRPGAETSEPRLAGGWQVAYDDSPLTHGGADETPGDVDEPLWPELGTPRGGVRSDALARIGTILDRGPTTARVVDRLAYLPRPSAPLTGLRPDLHRLNC